VHRLPQLVVFILALEDNGLMHDRITGTFLFAKNTITANIYRNTLQIFVFPLIYDIEHKEEGEILF
jgi:hypothetical protein